MKRSTWLGNGINPRMVVAAMRGVRRKRWPMDSSSRCSCSAMTRPMFGMKGNGCAGSMANGVSTGKTRSMNQVSSQRRSSSRMPAISHSSMPASASSRRRSSHTRCWRSSNMRARSLTASSCWAAVRPSGESWVRPERAWPMRPATRTEKNSSRLAAEMETKRRRSSSGWWVFSASSTTRVLKSSQESSRLMNRSGESAAILPEGSAGAGTGRRWIWVRAIFRTL